ncbi:hypothetical protein [Candidatus Nitrosocosmicus sp. T]
MNKMIGSGSTPRYIAIVILKTITGQSAKLRYLAVKDVEQWMK